MTTGLGGKRLAESRRGDDLRVPKALGAYCSRETEMTTQSSRSRLDDRDREGRRVLRPAPVFICGDLYGHTGLVRYLGFPRAIAAVA
jgi:hypothetical protein